MIRKPFIDNEGNIFTPDGDTFTLRIGMQGVTLDPGKDKVYIVVKDSDFKKILHKQISDIVNEGENEDGSPVFAAYFRMTSEDAKTIPAGDLLWGFTVYTNMRETLDGVKYGDEEVTPFGGSRRYHVEEVTSDGRK